MDDTANVNRTICNNTRTLFVTDQRANHAGATFVIGIPPE